VSASSTAPAPPSPAPGFRIRRGLDLPIDGAPVQDPSGAVERGAAVRTVALLGEDAPGVRPELRVALGDRVRSGQPLWVDRRRPELCFVAPGAGVVKSIERGERRRLAAVVIALEGDEEEAFEPVAPGALASLPRERLEALLLRSGLWTTLRTRPFGRIPDPGTAPRSLFVTALATDPLAPRVGPLLAAEAEAFARGLTALTRLTDGPVHVCARPGEGPALAGVPERVVPAFFAGPHPAGLAGTHIHLLDPAGPGREVWHVGWADVVAIGRLLATGRLPTERVVAVGGPSVLRPRLVRTRLGASTEELLRGELRGGPCRVISGSVLSGRHAVGSRGFLGRLHTQVCVLPEGAAPPPQGPFARLGGLVGAGGRAWTTALGGTRGAFYPLERLESVFPLDVPLLPLLRALAVGDVDAVHALGGLELAEEDLALVSYRCPGKIDWGARLRAALLELERRAA